MMEAVAVVIKDFRRYDGHKWAQWCIKTSDIEVKSKSYKTVGSAKRGAKKFAEKHNFIIGDTMMEFIEFRQPPRERPEFS